MDQKLKLFFDAINLRNDLYSVFENASVKDVKYFQSEQTMNLTIEIETLLDYRQYEELLNAVKNYVCKCNLYLEIKNPISEKDIDLIKIYYSEFLNTHYKESLLLNNLINLPIELVSGEIIINTSTDTLYDALTPFMDELNKYFNSVGVKEKIKVINLNKDYNDEFSHILQNDQQRAFESSKSNAASKEVVFENKVNKSYYDYNQFKKLAIGEISPDDGRVELRGKIFYIDVVITRNKFKRYNIYITDGDRSISLHARINKNFDGPFLDSLKVGDNICVRGAVTTDEYYKSPYIDPYNIEVLGRDEPRSDNSDQKRVELHLHTKMSTMDGVATAEDYINTAIRFGHKAIAITDHGVLQAFPEAQAAAKGKDIKVIYGMEGYIVNNKRTPVYKERDVKLKDATYVVFDLETTGLSNRYDKIIELGFVKYKDGMVIDTYQSFINPLTKLDPIVSALTNITDDMLISAPTIDQALPKILDFIKDSVLVAHNGTFDVGFLNAALKANNQEELDNPLIDTLDLARCIYPKLKRFNLGAVCKHLGISYGEDEAHRADYDAKVLASCWQSMIHELEKLNCHNVNELNSLSPIDAYKSERPYHMTFLCKNQEGLKNLNKLVSLSHIEYVTSLPLIPRDEISKYREGLLIGSACFNGEIFDLAQTDSEEKLKEAMKFYDYIEIQPLANYQWLVDTKRVISKDRLITILKGLVKAAQEEGKLIVATGDCHYLNPEDKIFRDVYVVAKAVGDKPHPLRDKNCNVSPEQHFRTTQEMIDGISYLNDLDLQRQFVITNTNKIADMIETVTPIKSGTFAPKLSYVDADKEIEDMCHNRAHELYGEVLPTIVEERMEKELHNIISNKYGVIYYLAYRLVKKSNEDGYLVGSRGSVGSSFVASLCGITEVNPLPPHYLCPNCHHSEFITDGSVRSGFDLEAKVCPHCGQLMGGNGQNIPFETFLGFKGDKCPDIDLNFSRDYQAIAHEYTKVLCGENNVFRAGTISTVAEKTAFGYARNYYETHGIENPNEADLRRLAQGCKDVKRTTGQHPAGIVVVPEEYSIYDFTAIQYPADEIGSAWKTTHFNFKSMHDELLKLDILGHLDPMAIKMLKDLTGIEPESIPMNDPEVLALFNGLTSLGVESYEVQNDLGSSGVPEFGTSFVKGVLLKAKPKKFSDLVQISGLTHGTDVWNGNAEKLIENEGHTLREVIGCRDDIMTDLIRYGMDKQDAFTIMEFVRKGNPSKNPLKWDEYVVKMKEANVPQWYIDSCQKIQYMFPKAHAVAYVVMALRVAWFKIHYPLEYYAAYFSVRCDKFDIETLLKGHDAILNKVVELRDFLAKNKDASNTYNDLFESMELALEMTARGYKFENISLEKSDAVNFLVDHEHNALIPPFTILDGLGEAAAISIVEARNNKPFASKEDLIQNTKINKTQVEILDKLGCLEGLDDKNQLTFDLDF